MYELIFLIVGPTAFFVLLEFVHVLMLREFLKGK